MDKPSFTFGPWKVSDIGANGVTITGPHGVTVGWFGANGTYGAVSYKITHTEALANATMSAAAPEMFKALKTLRAAFMTHSRWSGEPPAEVLAADAALSRAIGEPA